MKRWIRKISGQDQDLETGLSEEDSQETVTEKGAAPEHQAAQAPRYGLFKRLKEQMGRTRGGFIRQMDELLTGRREIDRGLLDELEEILVMADMGVGTVQEILDRLRSEVKRHEIDDPEALRNKLKEHILDLLEVPAEPLEWEPAPFVVLVVGVNGVGKTTTIAKLAYLLREQGRKVMLVAADTFRAAAVEQLETWGSRLDVPVFKQRTGTDPSAVAYDGMDAAKNRNMDVVIVDTAGRLHTKVNLMEELKKINRVISQKIPDAPHEILLVLDATTGQNAISQAKLFNEATGVTGIALTKLDGTAKGGIVVSIAHDLGIPIRFIGIGEKMEDLRPFDAREFVEAIFSS
ncbi:MAG TPA: signal recognition particle-docking protein FtsY [Thermodesulfobacteriaceae bacterium]|nr:signal recognition particle-docking protein FtsY [Thermodesulfobacteriaceae bacterium]